MTDFMKFFFGPLWVIKKYKRCNLNPNKSNLDSLELDAVWKYIKGGENINGSHNSLVYVMAQTDVIIHESFIP